MKKRCVLCNKPYNYNYLMFGRGCLDNMYELLDIRKSPRFIYNKELYLCTRIAWRNHKFFLNKRKKYLLAQKYIAIQYLDKMNFKFLDDIKNRIRNDIRNISVFSRNIIETISFSLNDIYKLFNDSQKFSKIINEFKNIDWNEVDKKTAENFIKSLSFIFDETKKLNPISYAVYYEMQYIFWQVVIIGGLLTDKKLSAQLLSNSLSPFGNEPNNLMLYDKQTVQLIVDSNAFKSKIKELIEKYGKDNNEFVIDVNKDIPKEDILIRFDSSDLLFALHDATLLINAKKNNDSTWNLDIEINDKYDFTDFKRLKEYVDSNKTAKSTLEDILSTLLNNFGVISSEYGVIKTYDLKIKFKLNPCNVENNIYVIQ